MGLKADFEEVRLAWPSYPWRLKIWLILSAFLASGAIASISETIIKWKGFVLDAVMFYQTWIALPLQQGLKALLPFPMPATHPHYLLLAAILTSANLRVIWLQYSPISLWSNKFIGALGPAFSVLWITIFAIMFSEIQQTIAMVGFAILPLNYIQFGRTFVIDRAGAVRLIWLVYVATPFCAVALLAAVNAGLRK
jgi:hypothetical protein